AALGGGDLLGGRLGQRVGTTDYEGLEGQPRVERRSAQGLMRAGIAQGKGPSIAKTIVKAGAVAGRGLRLGLWLDNCRAQDSRAHNQFDAADLGLFRLPAG